MAASSGEGQNLSTAAPFCNVRRREGWPERLDEFIASRLRTPFAWGLNDCATFAIDWVTELTGEVVWAVTWRSAREAQETLDRVGGMRAAWIGALGQPTQNWRSARRGDVGLVDIAGRQCGVVCTGQTWCGPDVERLQHLSLRAALLVWHIG